MSRFLAGALRAVTPYTPGEQPRGVETLIKLNTNENPYPPSPKVLEALNGRAAENLRLYSDPACADFLAALAETFGVGRDQVFAGNGSDEVLAFAFLAFCEKGVAFADITYGFYPVFAEMFSLPEYPELVPDPPVRYVQADGFGALTRCLAYRLSGMHLRLVGSKGCGKNTLIQTVDWLLNVPQYRMQGNAELDKLDLLGGPTIENGTMRYRLSDMLRYLAAGADVVLDEGNTIKPECADVLHSLTDAARQIQVPGYGLVQMHPHSAFTITMNEDYAGTNFMNEATIDRFTPIHIAEPESIVDVLHRVVPEASAASLNICDYVYCAIRDRIRSAGGLEPDAMTIRGFIDALRAEPLLGLRWGLLDNVASKPQDAYTRLQLTELIESMVPQDGRI